MSLTVLAAGEVFCDLPDGSSAFRDLTSLLHSADIVFADCEGVYADAPGLAPSRKVYHGAARSQGSMLAGAGFDVMTCANNHAMDGGEQGLAELMATLTEQGIAVTGVGVNRQAALTPAIVERNGERVAFLGFCSVFPVGYEARPDRPGLAPLRVRTAYASPDPAMWDPGIDPIITTLPDPGDRERFGEAIEAAAKAADRVIVACHWGYSAEVRPRLTPASGSYERVWNERLLDYEVELAREAVARGADAVVCHHQQSLRGIELYRGRPIFYGLGVLVNHFHRGPDRGLTDGSVAFPLFPFAPPSRRTGLAVIRFDGYEVCAGFIPAMIQADGSTEPLPATSAMAEEIAAHIERTSADSGLEVSLERSVDEGGRMLAWVRAPSPDRA